MSQENIYTAMNSGAKEPPSPTATQRRPISRVLSSDTTAAIHGTPGSRLSRSQTMMYPPGSGRAASPVAMAHHMQKSPTLYTKSHGSFDSGGFHNPAFQPSSTHTFSHLQRSMTAAKSGVTYGKNLWDEDEYVDTSGGSTANHTVNSPSGPASRRINQQRKMHAQTVKHPKNPFLDDDYADMTGHLSDASGMVELRNQHQYKSMKSPKTTKQFDLSQTDGGKISSDEGQMTPVRNQSVSSHKSSPQTPTRFQRSETNPAIFTAQTSVERRLTNEDRYSEATHTTSFTEKNKGVGVNKDSSNVANISSDFSDRHDSFTKDRIPKTNSTGQSTKSHRSATSPAHSVVSRETTVTVVTPSAPTTPVVNVTNVKNKEMDQNVAVVIDTAPASQRYEWGPGKAGKDNGEVAGSSTILHRDIKFEEPKSNFKKYATISLITFCVLLTIALIVVIAVLVTKINEQENEIRNLKSQLGSIAETTPWNNATTAFQTTSSSSLNPLNETTISSAVGHDTTNTLITTENYGSGVTSGLATAFSSASSFST